VTPAVFFAILRELLENNLIDKKRFNDNIEKSAAKLRNGKDDRLAEILINTYLIP
jgi:hypothetical protein